MTNKNSYNLLRKLLHKNNIYLDQEELKLQLLSYPTYPSLYALKGVLEHYNIESIAARLPVNEEVITHLPKVFIASVDYKGEEILTLVERLANSLFKITDSNGASEKVNLRSFINQWKGVILAVEESEENVITTRLHIQIWLGYVLMILVVGFFLFTNGSLFISSHFILSIIGLVFAIGIVSHEFGDRSSIFQNVCNLNEKISCNQVLNSVSATVLGKLKLSDLSVIVFSFYILNWLFLVISGSTNYNVIQIATILSLPFVLYSLISQAFIVKKWCFLCLGIVAVLSLQACMLLTAQASLRCVKKTGHKTILNLCSYEIKEKQTETPSLRC